jgi:MFS family permease
MRRVHYAWVMAAVTWLVLVTSAGFRATSGVLLVPLQQDLGWSQALIGGAVSLNLVVYGLGAPFAAAIVDRFGMRRVCTVALALVAGAAALSTRMTEPWQLYLLWGLIVGTATGAVSIPLAAIVSGRWFERRRGLVTGILSASNASGQVIFAPALATITTSYGWRAAAGTVAVVAIAIVAPLALVFFRSRPADIGLLPYGATVAPPPPAPLVNPFSSAIRTLLDISRKRDFWLLAGGFFICGATTNGLIGTHLISAGHDHGLSEIRGATLLATVGVFDIAGTIASGWLTDRVDPRKLLFMYYGFRGLSLLGLNAALNDAGAGLLAFIVFYGLDWVATVPPTVALCRDSFGAERVGVVFAWVFGAHQLGAAFAAWGAGASRVWFGSYEPAFLFAGALGVVAAVLSMLIGKRVVLRTA